MSGTGLKQVKIHLNLKLTFLIWGKRNLKPSDTINTGYEKNDNEEK